MLLKTYDRRKNVTNERAEWPFVSWPDGASLDVFQPGTLVTDVVSVKSVGIVIASNVEQTTILWSKEPRSNLFHLQFPKVNRVYGQPQALSLVSAQPMSVPHGDIFMIEYVYNQMSLFTKRVVKA